MTETLAYGYSSESTHRELSNEFQHDRILMVFKSLSILVLWTKEALALEGLGPLGDVQGDGRGTINQYVIWIYDAFEDIYFGSLIHKIS